MIVAHTYKLNVMSQIWEQWITRLSMYNSSYILQGAN